MQKISIRPYVQSDRALWDKFVAASRNGTFLHERGYLEYHADRFPDCSLLILKDDSPVALLPASQKGGVLYSHNGLTYGGLIVGREFHGVDACPVFSEILSWADGQNFKSFVYKPVPHIYHRMPAEEDLYAIFRLGGHLWRRDLSSSLNLQEAYGYSKGRKAVVKRSRENGFDVRRSFDWHTFMEIEAEHLATKHGTRPVHTADEICRLAGQFPDNIALHAAFTGDRMLGGVITYMTHTVCHAQYIGATAEGKAIGALDACLDAILAWCRARVRWFDFGISTTSDGLHLDEGLLLNKESWGARTTVYDHYEFKLKG